MAVTDNPAGRLHVALSAYSETRASSNSRSLEQVWAKALDVEQGTLRLTLARLAGLVPQIAELANAHEQLSGDDGPRRTVEHYREQWLALLVLPGVQAGVQLGSNGHISVEALHALGSIASTFALEVVEGDAVDSDTLGSIREDVASAVAGVRDANQLPRELRLFILARLHAVESAIDYYSISGTRGLREALDSLASASVSIPGDPTNLRVKVMHVVQQAYIAIGFFNATATTAEQLLAGARSIGLLQ